MIRPEEFTVSKHSDQGRGFPEDAANAVGLDASLPEGCQCGIRVVRGQGDEQTAGGLRIEEKILMTSETRGSKRCAFADEGAIVFKARGKMAFPGGFEGAWKIGEGCVIDFKGDRLE